MASGGRTGDTTEYDGATNESVLELLREHFPQLSSTADSLLFEPGSHDFGLFDYSAVVSNLCGTIGGGENSHGAAVLWVAASFLFCQKLIRVGDALDADLSVSSPRKIDYAILYKYCTRDSKAFDSGQMPTSVVGHVEDEAGKSSPTRAGSKSLSISDIHLLYVANMRLLVEPKLYGAYTAMICTLAREILATPFAAVAVHAMFGIACVAGTAFVKVAADADASESKLPPGSDGGREAFFPKVDVSDDLLQTLAGPLYGHISQIAVNAAMCGNVFHKTGEIDWPGSLAKYEENLVWLVDWDVAGRNDSNTAKCAAWVKPFMNGGEPERRLGGSTPSISNNDTRVSTEKCRIGCLLLRWDTETENALIIGRSRKLPRHSGWVCGLPDMLREVLLSTTAYYQYGLWPSGDWPDVETLWSDFAVYIGAMIRGWIIDHDTEADIGEHNASNWLCTTCARESGTLQWITGPMRPELIRSAREQQLAWGPQSYFYYSRRHGALARRVYSRKFMSKPGVQWGVTQCSDYLEPIPALESPFGSVGEIILHVLRLTGITVDATDLSRMCNAMPDVVDASRAGMCANCRVDGIGLDMMMYGHGVMVIAAMLPEPTRRKFVWGLDGYGGRAFPTLYSRFLSGCSCSGYWIEIILQLGYNWSINACGSDSCDAEGQVGVPKPQISGREWLKSPRTSKNLQNLTAACKLQFESMPTIRDQLQSGDLDESWSFLSFAGRVKDMIASQ